MPLKYSDALRNAQINAIETTAGATPILKIWAGTLPANCAAADVASNLMLCQIAVPTDFLTTAAIGSATINGGPWTGTGHANAGAGTAATHWRLYTSAGTVPAVMQGDVTTDLVLNNVNIATGQTVSVTQFTIAAGNG